jgi:hypothetical protein
VALGKARRRSERSKLDATPPWEVRKAAETPATTGPYDIRDAPGALDGDPAAVSADGLDAEDFPVELDDDGEPPAPSTGRIDFGALLVPLDTGLEVRVEMTAEGTATSVTLSNADGQMQLGVFAAPRTEGIWDEVRAEIQASLDQQGGTAEDQEGTFGTELSGRLPQNGGLVPVRFLGVDGPRWFLRAMLVGAAAADASGAAVFEKAFRRLVVVRGDTPLPVREPVPLVLPKDIAEQIAAASAAGEPASSVDPVQGDGPVRRDSRSGGAAPRRRRV